MKRREFIGITLAAGALSTIGVGTTANEINSVIKQSEKWPDEFTPKSELSKIPPTKTLVDVYYPSQKAFFDSEKIIDRDKFKLYRGYGIKQNGYVIVTYETEMFQKYDRAIIQYASYVRDVRTRTIHRVSSYFVSFKVIT